MTDFTSVDYFSDESVAADTYPYFDFLLEGRRVWREPHHGVVMVAGHEEVLAVLRDTASFSNCNIVAGPSFRFPVELTGDDVTGLVEQHRDELPMSDQIITFDPPKHTAHRGLLMGLITPKRLKENEEFMWRLADRQLDAVLPGGQCEFIDDFAQPYTLLVIADLLGVPESDHPALLRQAGIGRRLVGESGEEEDRHGPGALPRRVSAGADRRGPDRGQPVLRRPGDHGAAAQHRAAVHLRPARAAAAPAREPGAHPALHRGGAADGEPDQGRLPPRLEVDGPRRRGNPGRHLDHAAARRDRP
jgi:cytochrome P450